MKIDWKFIIKVIAALATALATAVGATAVVATV